MVVGVTDGYQKDLEVVGVGYRAEMKGKNLLLAVGYSHPILVKPQDGIVFGTEGPKITVKGADKELVGRTAATIRGLRPPEPYKGKGIKYVGERIVRKAGKTAGK
jgi:large subunit ribosomal protein L6